MHPLRFASAFAAALPLVAQAHEPPAPPVRSLGTVTVTGQPTSLPTEVPTTIEGVTREQIAQQVNATDSEDALKYLPSLLVRKRFIGDYNHAVLSTRASGTGNSVRSMVYADGILLSNFLGNGAAFAPRWMMVSPEEIERVDVLYGPFSAAYPGNSVGAVVDFVTRMPRTFEAHGKVGVSTQRFGLYATEATYAARRAGVSVGNHQGDWSWFLGATHLESDSAPLTFVTRTAAQGVPPGTTGAVTALNRAGQPWFILGTGTQYATSQDQWKARIAYDVTPTVRATYLFGGWRNASVGSAETYLRNGAGISVYTPDFGVTREQLAHWMHGLSVKSHLHGAFDWEATLSRYRFARDELRAPTTALPGAYAGGAGRIVDVSGTGWQTLAFRGTWRPHTGHTIDLGLQRDAYRLRSIENATTDWLDGTAAGRNNAFRGETRLTSAFAQDTWAIAQRWKAMLGLRLERWEAFGGETANAGTAVPHGTRNETHASPKAAIAYRVDEEWVLKASSGRAVRMPTVSELYQGGVAANGTLTNNDPALRPERSWTHEFTAERESGHGLWRVTAFFERTRAALYAQTNVTVTPNVTNIQNVDLVRTRGLETSYAATDVIRRGLDLSASATFADSRIARNDKFPASVGKWQPRVPRWRASAVATWWASQAWSHTLAARYSGRQYSTLDNSDPNGFAYQGASRYLTADWRTRWKIDRQWTLAAGIDNLANRRYWNFHPYPQRTYTAELRIDL